MRTKINVTFAFALFWLNTFGQSNWGTMLTEIWNGGAWDNVSLWTNTHDQNNYLTHNLEQSWNITTMAWQNSTQTNYTNNPNGTISQYLMQSWETGPNSWANSTRVTNSYSTSGKLINYLSEYWVGTWLPATQGLNTYDTNDYLVNSLMQVIDFSGTIWLNSMQTNFTNNANGSIQQIISQTWGASNSWNNQWRSTYTYNAANKIATETTESWDQSNWMNAERDTYTYDSNGHLTLVVKPLWDFDGSQWQDNSRLIYTNNALGDPIEIVYQVWNPDQFWRNEMRFTYSYLLSVGDVSRNAIGIFPNPASDFVAIQTRDDFSGQRYSILDANGRAVLSGTINTSIMIVDTSGFETGLYFVQIGSVKRCLKLLKN